MPLEGLIDFEKEIARLENQVNKLETEQQRLNGQLATVSFIERAPMEKVDGIRERVTEIEIQVNTLKQNLEALK